MKPHTLILALLAFAGTLQAVPINLAWDDPNPPGYVTKYTLYKKVFSATGSTWQKVKDIPAGTLTTTADYVVGQINVFSMTAWAGPIESAARAELDAAPPLIPANLKQTP